MSARLRTRRVMGLPRRKDATSPPGSRMAGTKIRFVSPRAAASSLTDTGNSAPRHAVQNEAKARVPTRRRNRTHFHGGLRPWGGPPTRRFAFIAQASPQGKQSAERSSSCNWEAEIAVRTGPAFRACEDTVRST